VAGGRCSAPLGVAVGYQRITEEASGLPAGDAVSAITVARKAEKVRRNLASRSATIDVRSGSTTTNETVVVTFTDKVAPAQLKICKVAGTTDLISEPFKFTENGGAAFPVMAGPGSDPGCSHLTPYRVGTKVDVAERPTSGTLVSSIKVRPAGEASHVNLAAGTVTVTLKPGVTVVTYTNVSHSVPDIGTLQVCKLASDQFVTGSFEFTITAPGFTETTQPIGVNHCTPKLTVPGGDVTVTETPRSSYFVSDVYTTPSNRLVSQNDAKGSAVISIVAGSTGDTQVFFVNDTRSTQVKV
jgi:hypothetical protein